jgi:hypothetical protein
MDSPGLEAGEEGEEGEGEGEGEQIWSRTDVAAGFCLPQVFGFLLPPQRVKPP